MNTNGFLKNSKYKIYRNVSTPAFLAPLERIVGNKFQPRCRVRRRLIECNGCSGTNTYKIDIKYQVKIRTLVTSAAFQPCGKPRVQRPM